MAEPLAVTDATFEQVVLNSSKLVMVDFWAAWCPPCRALAPIVAELAGEYGKTMTFAKLNVDENPQIAGRFSITSIPTLLLFHKSKVIQQIVGLRPKKELKEILDKALVQASGSLQKE